MHITADSDLSSSNEMNTSVSLSGPTLTVTDGGGSKTANLSSLDQTGSITGLDTRIKNDSTRLNIAKSDYETRIKNDSFALQMHIIADGDLSSSNEMNTSISLSGSTLTLTDGGGSKTANLSSLDQTGSITGLDTRIKNDSTRLNIARSDYETRIKNDSFALQMHITADGDLSSTNEIQNILINISNDSLLISDGQGIALNKLFQIASISIDSLEDAYNDTNLNLILGSKPNNLVKSGANSAKNNVGIGNEAFSDNTTGSYNVGIGIGALYKNTTGGFNSAIGQEALHSNKVGNENTAIGRFALYYSTANGNTAIGSESSGSNTTGQFNTSVGRFSLKSNKNGSDNSALGSNADVADTNLSYATAIGAGAIVKASNTIQLGSSSIDSVVTSGKLKLGNVIYPNTDGTNGQVLVTDGSGNLSFQDTDTIGVVPYTGAIQAVNLGAFDLTVNSVKIGLGSGNVATNIALGNGALRSNATGNNNTAIGSYALEANTTGTYNTASGTNALNKNTIGRDNTASGVLTLQSNTTGVGNTASGANALRSNTIGNNNTASGYQALNRNTTGSSNTASGIQALYLNTTGTYNTAIGFRAMEFTTTSNNNVAFGNQALKNNRTGSGNTAIGSVADVIDINLNYATAIGFGAIVKASNTIQLGNSSIDSVVTAGKLKLGNVIYPNTDGTSGQVLATNGAGNLAWAAASAGAGNINGLSDGLVETNSLYVGNDPSATTLKAERNVAVGATALKGITTGDDNTATGFDVLYSNIIGSENTGSGSFALQRNTTGNNNTAAGHGSLTNNISGHQNTATGERTLFNNTGGFQNTASGAQALYLNTTGARNTASGYRALGVNTIGNYNTAIGYEAGVTTGALNNSTAIGYTAKVSSSNTIQLGNSSIDSVVTAGKLKLGNVIYPNTDGTSGQVLATDGAGNAAWAAASAGAGNVNGLSDGLVETNSMYIGNDPSATTNNAQYNVAVGATALKSVTTGSYNTATGNGALTTNTTGNFNTATGLQALYSNITANYNTASGYKSLFTNTKGQRNTAIGLESLFSNTGSDNVSIGARSGRQSGNSSGNIFIGAGAGYSDTSSNKLYIENSSGTTPLIWGDFASNYVNINGRLGIGTTTPSKKFHIKATDNSGDIHLEDAFPFIYLDITSQGNAGFQFKNAGKNKFEMYYSTSSNSFIINHLQSSGHDLTITSAGNFGIGVSAPTQKLEVAGKIKTTTLQVTNGAGANKVLMSDKSGNASWSASMPNVTRSIAIAPGMFPTEAFSGSQTKKKMLGGWQLPVIEMVDGKLGQIAMSMPLPSDWVAGTAVKLKLLYSSSTNSGTISFSFGSAKLAENASTITGTGSSTVSLNVSSTVNGLKEYSYSISTNSTTKVLHFYLRRRGTDTSDTNTGIMYIHGVNLEYTAN